MQKKGKRDFLFRNEKKQNTFEKSLYFGRFCDQKKS
jgi:hypothetical protein